MGISVQSLRRLPDAFIVVLSDDARRNARCRVVT